MKNLGSMLKELNKYEKSIETQKLAYVTKLDKWSRITHRFYDQKCMVCGASFEDRPMNMAQAHHIYPRIDYPKYAFEVWNCVMLCSKHHRMAHDIYDNYSLEYYLKKLQELVEERNIGLL